MVRQKKQGRWKRPLNNKTFHDPKEKGKWGCPKHGKEKMIRFQGQRKCECGYRAKESGE